MLAALKSLLKVIYMLLNRIIASLRTGASATSSQLVAGGLVESCVMAQLGFEPSTPSKFYEVAEDELVPLVTQPVLSSPAAAKLRRCAHCPHIIRALVQIMLLSDDMHVIAKAAVMMVRKVQQQPEQVLVSSDMWCDLRDCLVEALQRCSHHQQAASSVAAALVLLASSWQDTDPNTTVWPEDGADSGSRHQAMLPRCLPADRATSTTTFMPKAVGTTPGLVSWFFSRLQDMTDMAAVLDCGVFVLRQLAVVAMDLQLLPHVPERWKETWRAELMDYAPEVYTLLQASWVYLMSIPHELAHRFPSLHVLDEANALWQEFAGMPCAFEAVRAAGPEQEQGQALEQASIHSCGPSPGRSPSTTSTTSTRRRLTYRQNRNERNKQRKRAENAKKQQQQQ